MKKYELRHTMGFKDNPVELDENLKIEIKEESNSNIVLEDKDRPISFSSYVQFDTVYSLSDWATDIIRGEVLSYRVENVIEI